MSDPIFRSITVFLVRHGESLMNQAKRISGRFDTPLSPKGYRYSQALAKQFRDVPLTAIYTSSLKRTIDTARPTAEAHGLPIQSHAALNELHFGVLEGRFRDARDPEALALWEARKRDKRFYQIPDGERFIDMAERVTHALNNILAYEVGGTILIVGHRNVNRVLFGMLMQEPEEQWPYVKLKSQCVYRIVTGSSPKVITSTLGGERSGMLSSERVHLDPRLSL